MNCARALALLMLTGSLLIGSTMSCDKANPYQTPCTSAADCVLPYVCCHDTGFSDIDFLAPNTCIEPMACSNPDPFLVAGNPCERGGDRLSSTQDPRVLGRCGPSLICCPGTLTCAESGACPTAKPPTTSTRSACTVDEECSAAEVCCEINAFDRQGVCTSVDDCGGKSELPPDGTGGSGGNPGCVGPGLSTPADPCALAPADGLAMYLRLDETSGDACDASGKGNSATVSSSEQRGADGKFGKAVLIKGDGLMFTPAQPISPTTGMSVAMWIRPSTATGTLFFFRGSSSSSHILSIALIDGVVTVSAGRGLTPQTFNTPTAVVATDAWTHLAFTDDGASSRIDINGVTVVTANGGFVPTITTTTYIGSGGNNSNHMAGLIDEVRLWDVARTPAQICEAAGGKVDPACGGCAMP